MLAAAEAPASRLGAALLAIRDRLQKLHDAALETNGGERIAGLCPKTTCISTSAQQAKVRAKLMYRHTSTRPKT